MLYSLSVRTFVKHEQSELHYVQITLATIAFCLNQTLHISFSLFPEGKLSRIKKLKYDVLI